MNEVVKQVEKMVDDKRFDEALAMAEELIGAGTCSPHVVLALYVAKLRIHSGQCELDKTLPGDEPANNLSASKALAAGQTAMELAAELGEWDYYGAAARLLGVTHGFLRQYAQAINYFTDYLAHSHLYSWASEDLVLVWYNLGMAYALGGQHDKVVGAFQSALAQAEVMGDQRVMHGIRQAIAEQYIRISELHHVPRLLAACGKYLRHNRYANEFKPSWLFHIQLRVKFAAKTGRHNRACLLALRGIVEAEGDIYQRRTFHMLLAANAYHAGMGVEAVKHCIAAQVYSGYMNRKDWEDEATELMKRASKALEPLSSESGLDWLNIT